MISIIIPCHNAYEYTSQCIESIERNTHIGYELIVVDNGSTDETINCEYVKIRNETNLGFAKAVNKGMRISNGEYLCILNNDTIVTPHWLTRMLWHIEKGGYDFISPCSTFRKADQGGDIGYYNNIEELERISELFYEKHKHSTLEIDIAVGFCMFFSRNVFNTVGYFDERFGLGNFEDIDYGRRAKTAGFRIGVAKDVFIHHFVMVTHRLLGGKDFIKELLKTNKRKYEEKWDEGHECQTRHSRGKLINSRL